MASEEKKFPNRTCDIPGERSILFPIINCEANPLEYPELRTERELIEHVTRDENTIVTKDCLVDGTQIPAQRVKSDPTIFKVEINDENVYGFRGASTIASGDGFWVFLRPLSSGNHSISFWGACEKGKLKCMRVANSLNIQNIPVKRVHVGDIDIVYKMFGNVTILLFNALLIVWMPGTRPF